MSVVTAEPRGSEATDRKINAISVPAEAGSELERRFAARAGTVDGSPGFLGFQLLRPLATGANLLEFEVVMDVKPAS